MLVAALDTATLTLSCALADVSAGGAARVRCSRTDRQPAKAVEGKVGGHGAALPQALVDLLHAEGLAIPDVEGFAVGLGPGSFTGLRVGLATWKGLAYANRRPIAGASSLAAMALAAAADAEDGDVLVPLLDAKKGEVYAGFYRVAGGGVVPAAPEAALAPARLGAFLSDLAPRGRVLGDGVRAYREALASVATLATDVETPPALAVARLCARELEQASYDAAKLFALEPHYVRASEAEIKFPHGLGAGATKPG